MTWRVRGATPSDDEALGRILWEAFGRKMHPFLRPRGPQNPQIFADLLAAGALRRESARVVALAEGTPVGVCFVRLPGVPYGAIPPMAGLALRHGGPWRALWTFFGLLMLDEPARPGVATITLLAVAPESRGQGAGGALLGTVEAEVRARGLHRLALHVIENNPARRLYERHGFRTLRTHQMPRRLGALVGYARFEYMEKSLR